MLYQQFFFRALELDCSSSVDGKSSCNACESAVTVNFQICVPFLLQTTLIPLSYVLAWLLTLLCLLFQMLPDPQAYLYFNLMSGAYIPELRAHVKCRSLTWYVCWLQMRLMHDMCNLQIQMHQTGQKLTWWWRSPVRCLGTVLEFRCCYEVPWCHPTLCEQMPLNTKLIQSCNLYLNPMLMLFARDTATQPVNVSWHWYMLDSCRCSGRKLARQVQRELSWAMLWLT